MSCKLFSVILLSFLFFYIVECGTKKSWKIEKIIKSDEARSTSSATTEIPDIKITSTTAPPTTTADLIDDNATIVNDFEEEDEEEQEDEDNSIEAEDLKLDIVETEKNETKISLEDVANMTIDETSSTVNVTLNGEKVKQIFTGRGGKRYGLLERVVPLFILPFLIQSAFVPFIVTTIKLFLMKSLFAGKIAILFLLLGALKSHQNNYMKSLSHPPFYMKDFPQYPERRFETVENTNTNYNGGYKVEGRPSVVVN